MATYTPLASPSDIEATPLVEVLRDVSEAQRGILLTRASRAVESKCKRRLSPFTVTEAHRADAVDFADASGFSGPMSDQAVFGLSRANSLGGFGSQVRHIFLRQFPPLWEDLWSGVLLAITSEPSLGGVMSIPLTGVQFEAESGHVRVPLGTYLPDGATVLVNYSGGYVTTPDDLLLAVLYKATEIALQTLLPERKNDVDTAEMALAMDDLLTPYKLDAQ